MNKLKLPSCVKCKNMNKLFCGIKADEREHLSTKKKGLLFKKGEVIFQEGRQPFGLFCIHRGKVKLTKLGADGKEFIVRLYNKGESFGYRALLGDMTYSTTASALEESEICHIPNTSFFEKLNESHQLGKNAMQILAENLKDSEDQLITLTKISKKERVARALLHLKTKFGNDEATLTISLTRREIGEIAGITTESAIRSLSELKKENVIELIQKKIKIIDMKQLHVIANTAH